MKNLITSLALFITILGYSQSKANNEMVEIKTTKIEHITIEVSVDSEEEIESTFKMNDIKEILESSVDNEIVSFEITCNSKEKRKLKSHVSYKIEGSTDEKEALLHGIEKIRNAAIKYYQN